MTTATRREKVRKMLESFSSLRRITAFRPIETTNMPAITPSQWGALMTIERRGESTVKDVARALGITSSAATQLVDGLVESGYVVKKVNAEDRRVISLTLSSKTKVQVEAMKKQALQKFLKFFEVLNHTEFNQYIMLNKKIVERLLKNKNV